MLKLFLRRMNQLQKGDAGIMKIAICDDEKIVLDQLEHIINYYSEENELDITVSLFNGDRDLLYSVERLHEHYDLVIIDIGIEYTNSIAVATEIKNIDKSLMLIFTTYYKENAYEAFSAHPFNLLLKPLQKDVVENCLDEVCDYLSMDNEYYEFERRKNTCRVLLKDIMYFKSDKRIVNIYMKDGKVYSYYDRLDYVENKLKKNNMNFLRIHKSFIVNSAYVFRQTYKYVLMDNGEILSVSRCRRKEIINKKTS